MPEDQNLNSGRPLGPLQVDSFRLEQLRRQMRDNQNLTLGILGGALGAVIGAVAWGLLTWMTHLQIGYAAIGVGFLAGLGVRLLGRGINTSFAVVGAVMALLGVLLGNLFWACIEIARQEGVPVSTVAASLNSEMISAIFRETFSPIDLLFYGIAVWAGFKYARVNPPDAEVVDAVKTP